MSNNTITFHKINEVIGWVETNSSIDAELEDFFKFRPKGFQFSPKFKKKLWDGYIRLYSRGKRQLHVGLYNHLRYFARDRGYDLQFSGFSNFENEPDIKQHVLDYIAGFPVYNENGEKISPRDYQIDVICKAIFNQRRTIKSPTGSGKSLMIYYYIKYLLDTDQASKILLVVPTVDLVSQMYGDFSDYAKRDINDLAHTITAGCAKDSHQPVYISTWQSIYKQPLNWFKQFDALICDEVHHYTEAKVMQNMVEKCTNAKWRLGTTGTIQDLKVHKMMIEALLGPVYSPTTTQELIAKKHLSSLKIYCPVLKYTEAERKTLHKKSYPEEMEFINFHQGRRQFIVNTIDHLNGNSLILFKNVEDQCIPMYKKIKEAYPDRNVYMVHGGVSKTERADIREAVKVDNDAIIVATYGTYSTGINIKSISAIVLGSPVKGEIKLLQSIGRGLRTHKDKERLIIVDICDNLEHNGRANYTLNHFIERTKIYRKEGFDFTLRNITL